MSGRGIPLITAPEYLRMRGCGVDISNSSVKALTIHNGNVKTASASISEDVFERGDVVNQKEMVRAIKEATKGMNTPLVHVALPEQKTFIVETVVDATKDIEAQIQERLPELVPLPPTDTIFSYSLLKGTPTGETRVSVVAFARRVVNEYVSLFEQAGLTVLSVELETQAIMRSIMDPEDIGAVLIVDIGKTSTKVAIAAGGALVYTATLELGGGPLTTTIMEKMQVDQEQADRVKNDEGFSPQLPTDVVDAMKTTMLAIKDELDMRIRYWEGRVDRGELYAPPIREIILCGGNANLRGLPDFLGALLKIPVSRATVWRNVMDTRYQLPPIHRTRSYELGTVIGLALHPPFTS